MAASQFDKAYFSDPDGSRPLITELLRDPDPRVVTCAHKVLAQFGSDTYHGERNENDDRGSINLEFIASLPIHHMTAIVSAQGRVVEVKGLPTV